MKRRSLRSINSSRSISTTPATWLRKPRSAYSSLKRMPERPFLSASTTACASLPRHETMPRPVTTTRRMEASYLEIRGRGEQADPQVFRLINFTPIDRHRAIGNTEDQSPGNDALDMNVVGHLFGFRQNLTGEFHFTAAEGTTTSGMAKPTQVEAHQLPHGIQTQTTGHDRVTGKMAIKEPEVGVNIQLGNQFALVEPASLFLNTRDAIKHQHVGRRQLGIAGAEEFAAAASQQFFAFERVLLGHWIVPSRSYCGPFRLNNAEADVAEGRAAQMGPA